MLILDHVSFRLGHKFLVHDVSLRFRAGMITGILGTNGSGKSTLLRVLSGIWKATGGTLFWNDKDLLSLERRALSRLISLVPQNPQILFDYTVKDVVSMGQYPLEAQNLDGLVEAALRQVDAWHLRERLVTQLSGGERQRVYIARSLVTQSPVVLLDEPCHYLDVRHQRQLWQLLEELRQQGKMVVLALHNLSAAKHYCQETVLLANGEVVASGPFDQVLSAERLEEIFGLAPHQLSDFI